jgi:hypothetical protein
MQGYKDLKERKIYQENGQEGMQLRRIMLLTLT